MSTRSEETLILPLEGGSPRTGIGLAFGPAIGGLIALAIGLFVFGVLSRKADPNETNGLRLFGAVFMLFGVLFIRVGVGSVWTTLRARRRERRAAEPWLKDHDWRHDGSAPRSYDSPLGQVLGTAFYIALVLPFNTIWTADWPEYWGFWIVVGVLDLIALAAVYESFRRVVQAIRAGRTRLAWTRIPFHVGSRFDATFSTGRPIAATGPLRVTLRAIHQRWGRRQKKSAPSKDSFIVYSETKEMPLPAGGATEIPLAFDVPASVPGTHLARAEPVFWQVSVTAPTTGPDFKATFMVPIYAHTMTSGDGDVVSIATGKYGRQRSRGVTIVATAIVGILGMLFLWSAATVVRNTRTMLAGSVETEGVVLRQNSFVSSGSGRNQGSTMYQAVVGFEANGRTYEIEESVASGSPTYREHERVTVIYPKENPAGGRIKTFMDLYFSATIFGFFGAMFVGAALVMLLVFERR